MSLSGIHGPVVVNSTRNYYYYQELLSFYSSIYWNYFLSYKKVGEKTDISADVSKTLQLSPKNM